MCGKAVDLLESGVDGQVPQSGVENRDPDGGLGDQPRGERDIALHLAQPERVGTEPEGVEVTVVVQQPHVAQLHQPRAAVLAPDGKRAAPAPAGLHDLGELGDHPLPLLFVNEQLCGVLPERLLGGVAVQLLGLRTPQNDPPLGVQQHRRDTEEVHQPARL